jgi:hypothetical protein
VSEKTLARRISIAQKGETTSRIRRLENQFGDRRWERDCGRRAPCRLARPAADATGQRFPVSVMITFCLLLYFILFGVEDKGLGGSGHSAF